MKKTNLLPWKGCFEGFVRYRVSLDFAGNTVLTYFRIGRFMVKSLVQIFCIIRKLSDLI